MMTPMQYELHEARKQRLQRMKAWHQGNVVPIRRIPEARKIAPPPPPKIKAPETRPTDKPIEHNGWFWPADKIDPEHIKIQHVVQAVCSFYKVSSDEITSSRKYNAIVRPRMVASYLARTLTTASWGQIGRVLKKDHTTIMHGYRKVEPTAKSDPEIQQILETLTKRQKESDDNQTAQ